MTPPKALYANVAGLDQLCHLQLSFTGRNSEIHHWLSLVLMFLPPSVQNLELSAIGALRIFGSVFYESLDETYTSPTSSPMQLPMLKHRSMKSIKLELYLDTITDQCAGLLETLLLQCPDLNSLAFNFGSEGALSKATKALSKGVSRKLKTFSVQLPRLYQDELFAPLVADPIALCLNALEAGPLKELVTSEGRQNSLWPSLRHHLPHLESLALHNTHGQDIGEVSSIFRDCAHLRHLSLESDEYDRHVWNPWCMGGLQPWSFSHNLTRLSLLASCTPSDASQNDTEEWNLDDDLVALYPKTIPQTLYIYVHLARLVHLESLRIGVVHKESFEYYERKGLLTFDFSLRSGLAILAPLQRLRRLAFFERKPRFQERLGDTGIGQQYIVCPMEPQIGQEEAE